MTPRQDFQKKARMPRRLEPFVVEKPWGRTDISRAFGDFGERAIGEIWFTDPDGRASQILVKFLFTSERLSIQVHPDGDAAKGVGLPSGKDECWLVLAADPGAELGVGLKRSADRSDLRDAALDGSIAELIDWRTAAVNDFIYNPAGTIHAMGAGLTVVEIQQNINCTYRLYDYGRTRALHLDEGLAVARLEPGPDPRDCRVDPRSDQRLVDGPHFHVLHLTGPIDRSAISAAAGEFIFVPLSSGCYAAGEALHLGDAVVIEDPALIDIAGGARALLTWPA
ncbi:MAG: class I mannose-6-phosphate isomerase [Sphingopyxis sp.]|nr:class I mannose-6-phosphate isomerase [Sphingopyxis sp.]